MNTPDEVLATTRTRLLPFAARDSDELLHLFRDPEVRGYLLDDVCVALDWVQDEIEASGARFARTGTGMWSVRLSGAAQIVGFVGFREFFDPPQLNLLYGLLPEYWGRGLAIEVTSRVCDFVFRDLSFAEITAATDIPNRASSRVLQRLGMKLVGTNDDGVAGTAIYALDRGTWLARAPVVN